MSKTTGKNHVFYRDLEKEYPIIERADGVYLYDDAGNRYLDFGSGIGVVNIGYSVPEINEAMAAQADQTSFVYTAPFTTKAQIKISKKIIDMSPEGMSKVLLVSGGSMAMESAIKLAIKGDGVDIRRFFFHLFVVITHATSSQNRYPGCLASYHMQGYRATKHI